MADSDAPNTDKTGEGEPDTHEEREDREHDRSFRRLGDSLISNLLGDSSAAFKRGQGLVTGVAQGTKEELVRMISHEVRGFLDKMDAADLVQEIVSGLVIEMKTEIRFRRDESGRVEPEIRTTEARVESEPPPDKSRDKARDKAPDKVQDRAPDKAPEARRRPMGQVVKDFKDKVKPKQGKGEAPASGTEPEPEPEPG